MGRMPPTVRQSVARWRARTWRAGAQWLPRMGSGCRATVTSCWPGRMSDNCAANTTGSPRLPQEEEEGWQVVGLWDVQRPAVWRNSQH